MRPRKPVGGLTAINQFLEAATKNSLRSQGFTVYGIVADWEKIVGSVLARYSVPTRLRRDREGSFASLEIHIAAGIGLEFQHYQPQVIERINQYYGYRAVTRIHLRQGYVPPAAPPAPAPLVKALLPPHLAQAIDQVTHVQLRQALRDLGAAIYVKPP
ncbi:MAG: DciA family protein [Candidatus Symbiobacter sp.]|nr:DciA family protein [Candidatus Symbiobacter sp.]